MLSIIVGLVLISGGLSGQLVLIGTESSVPVIVFGVLILAFGIHQSIKR